MYQLFLEWKKNQPIIWMSVCLALGQMSLAHAQTQPYPQAMPPPSGGASQSMPQTMPIVSPPPQTTPQTAPQAAPQGSEPATSLMQNGGGAFYSSPQPTAPTTSPAAAPLTAPLATPPPAQVQTAPPSVTPTLSTNAQPQFISDQLAGQTGCRPQGEMKCSAVVKSAAAFAAFMTQCPLLTGWLIQYPQTDWLTLTIVGGASTSGCQVMAEDKLVSDKPKRVTCALTHDQITLLTDSNVMEALKQYDINKQTNDAFLRAWKPLSDCIRSMDQSNGTPTAGP